MALFTADVSLRKLDRLKIENWLMRRSELFRQNLWMVIRRSARDRRARGYILGLLGLLSYLTYLVWTFAYLGIWGTICWAVVVSLAIGLAILMRKSNERTGESMLSLSSPAVLETDDLSKHRVRIAAALLRVAILVDRAGGENLHRLGKIRAQSQGTCRRRTLDLARKPDLWETFTSEERNSLLAPEGSWEWDAVWPRVLQVEDVRVLRWVLKLDPILTPFEFLKPDLIPALEISTNPQRIEGKDCMAPWDLRPAHAMAEQMLNRCVAEGVHRGFLTIEDHQTREAFIHLAEKLGENQSEDLLIGSNIVADADRDRIEWVAQAALRRTRILSAVIKYLNSPPQEELERV